MPHNHAPVATTNLFRRLVRRLTLRMSDKQALSVSTDRMTALDDPRTRRALAGLPVHLLRDVGVQDARSDTAQIDPPEGEALRRHLW